MEQQTGEFLAHSANSSGMVQSMKDHSSGVGKFMREFALSESFADLYEFCGLIHDIGKYSNEFQRYIAGGDLHVSHSIYGAMFAQDNSLMEIAFPVFGHHAGLPDNQKMRQTIMAEYSNASVHYNDILNTWKSDCAESNHLPNDKEFWRLSDILQQELFVRMLFSSLVDADSLDTERHFQKAKFQTRASISIDSRMLIKKLQKELDGFDKETEINKLRNEVRLFAESKASLPQGFFSLTLPTGLGKTLCSVSWALHHANCHSNIKRIIIVLPFINIIDQTAEKLKSIFNDNEKDYVLEHHSNVIYLENEDKDEYNSKLLAIENWDYPIVITTSVQFFESLFSNKRSACRKLHNIQDSIVIFDEIQTLPMSVTEPTLTMLDNLQQLCRCSILFCTATQPDFHTRDGFRGLQHIESLVENPQRVFEETRRIVYHPLHNYEEMTISELSDHVVKGKQSTLVVFNTKKKARLFFEEMRGCGDFKLFHLSTNMCPSHRKKTICEIRTALEIKEKIVVSSTQLIEAGVDMDFPSVYRELAPLESIIQSAGRCNREGKMTDIDGNQIKGDVYLFALTESGQPSKQYRSWSEFANLLYRGSEEKLYTHDFYSEYYRKLSENLVNTDKYKITEDRKSLNYQTVADKYKIIEKSTQPIFVYKYSEKSLELYHRLKFKDFLTRQERQEVAQYCVQVYDKFREDNDSLIRDEQNGLSIWYGSYDQAFGLPFKDEFNPII